MVDSLACAPRLTWEGAKGSKGFFSCCVGCSARALVVHLYFIKNLLGPHYLLDSCGLHTVPLVVNPDGQLDGI